MGLHHAEIAAEMKAKTAAEMKAKIAGGNDITRGGANSTFGINTTGSDILASNSTANTTAAALANASAAGALPWGGKRPAWAAGLTPEELASLSPAARAALARDDMLNQMRSKIRAELEKKFKRRMVKTVADRVSNEVPDELALQVAKDFPVFFQRFKQMHNTGVLWGQELAAARRHAMSQLKLKLIGEVQAEVTRKVQSEERQNMEANLNTAV